MTGVPVDFRDCEYGFPSPTLPGCAKSYSGTPAAVKPFGTNSLLFGVRIVRSSLTYPFAQ